MIGWGNPIQFGVGDGTTTQFQITDLGGFAIPLPSGGTIQINGTTTSAYTVSSTGLITFTTAPASGAKITLVPPSGYTDNFWVPQMATRSVKPAVWQAKFGDGYEQNTPQGLNYKPESWNLTFYFSTLADAEAFQDYISGFGGTQAFYWRSPRGPNAIRVLCRSWSDISHPGQRITMTAKFDQVYGQ
ncbi:MAG: phage tail protein [Patescibacteria group bacterium]|nr:phage tail protein [Patescibacteria group bacterium]